MKHHDPDDPPPPMGWLDWYYHHFNRWAEQCAAYARAFGFLSILIVCTSQVHAKWKPEYANNSPEVQAWYQNAETTPEAYKRTGYKKCCAHADVVRTSFRTNKVNGHDEWWYLVPETQKWKQVPNDIIHWAASAPDNQPTLFVYDGKELCFFPPSGGA